LVDELVVLRDLLMADQMVASTADKTAAMMVYEWVAMWAELMVW
jgi:hypothetical protein